jgi:hypothetical protein
MPKLIKFDTYYSWVKGIQVVQLKGRVLFKGEIIAKMGWGHLKFLFLRTTKPEKLNFT